MAEFVKIELTFHARAMEMYTQCYQSLSTQSQQDDLQVSCLSDSSFPSFFVVGRSPSAGPRRSPVVQFCSL